MRRQHQKSLFYLCISSFLLFAAPKTNVQIGPIPIYLIDIFLLITFLYSRTLTKIKYKPKYSRLVNFILTMIIINEILNGIIIGTLIQPLYITVRMTLAVSLFYSIPKILRNPKHLMKVLKFSMVGALVTAILLIFSSLPYTRSLSLIFLSNSFLTPNADQLFSVLSEAGSQGLRGTSLIGVSILSGAFLNVIWPLLLLFFSFYKPKNIFKIVFYLTVAIIPIAIIMTYSRGAILGLFLTMTSVTILLKTKYKFIIISFLLLLFLGISSLDLKSDIYQFDRLENRTRAAFSNPFEDERESERFNAYIQPFEHLFNNPRYILFGEGFARFKISGKLAYINTSGRADHAVFAKAYYGYGLITSLAIVLFYFRITFFNLRKIVKLKQKNLFVSHFIRLTLALLIGFSSWFSFGHAAVSQPRGTMLMFFVFGLIASQKNMFRVNNNHLVSEKII